MRIGFGLLFLGIVVLLAALDAGAGARRRDGPLLLAGLGIGALASQLGAVTVSAVPDSQSGEVGGIQNTVTNLGASIGTALSGAILIAVLTTTFFGSVAANPAIPKELTSQAQVELSAGIPFVSDVGPERQLCKRPTCHRRRPPPSSTRTRRAGSTVCVPRSPCSPSSRLLALLLTRRLPTVQPGDDDPGPASLDPEVRRTENDPNRSR